MVSVIFCVIVNFHNCPCQLLTVPVFHNCPCQFLTVPVIIDAGLSVTFFDLSQYIYPSFSLCEKNEAPLFAVASSSIWSVRRDNEHPVTRHCVHSSEGNNKMAAAVLQSLSSSLFAYYFSFLRGIVNTSYVVRFERYAFKDYPKTKDSRKLKSRSPRNIRESLKSRCESPCL
jgi:hypothetical protein